MKPTMYSVFLCQTCCVYAATAFTLHLHRNVVNYKTGNITNEGIVNILSDNVIRLKQSSHGSESGPGATNFFNTSIINQTIDNFRSAYTSFYQLLQPFLAQLSQRFKEGTSPTLQKVNVITEVMPLDDLDILTGNTANIIHKFFVVQETLLAVLDNIRRFVLAIYLEWFRRQSLLLEWRMNSVGFVVLSLGLRDEAQEVSSMDSFYTKYPAFFEKLQEFVPLMCQRYKTDAPETLQDVSLICTVLKPDDLDSPAGEVAKKYNIVKYVMTLVFGRGGPYLDEEHLGWFQEQSQGLQQMIEELTNSLATLTDGRDSEGVTIVSPGISGVNGGIKHDNYRVLAKLRKVIEALQ